MAKVSGSCLCGAVTFECGGALPYVSSTGKSLVVPAGSLDQTPSIEPQDNIFVSEKAPWYDKALSCKAFSTFPE